MNLNDRIAARLAEIADPNMIDVYHVSAGDNRLPKHLRGETPDVPRLPTVSEVRGAMVLGEETDAETIDSAIGCACEKLLDSDDPAWTDDLCCHPIRR